jgi:dUTP pyrophosphatase
MLKFKRLPHAKDLPLPRYARPGDAGMDLCAAIDEPIVVLPGRLPTIVPTGFSMELPPGCEGQVRPRSGLASKTGLMIANSPGTIDSSYRGELKIALINNGPAPVEIKRGDRIAQLVVAPVLYMPSEEVAELSATERGEAGFGSTGS